MSTLNSKRLHRLCANTLLIAVLSTVITIVPVAHASIFSDFYQTLMAQFRLSPKQLDNLLLVNEHATTSGHPEVIQALMLQESGAGINTKSNGNCHGVMQIMTSTAMGIVRSNTEFRQKHFGVNSPTSNVIASKLKTDVVFSIEVADQILAGSLKRTSDLNRAVLAYNMGEKYLKYGKTPMQYVYVRDISHKIKNTTAPLRDLIQLKNSMEQSMGEII